jgi:hypothetical protein
VTGALILLIALVWTSAATAAQAAPVAGPQVVPLAGHKLSTLPYEACAPATAATVACQAIVYPTGGEEEVSPALECNCGSGLENGFSPQDLESAYKLPVTSGGGQAVAVVDAFDDPHAEEDLAVYRETYGLPPCTAAAGCFRKVDQRFGTHYPAASESWSLEISLDLDMVSAACPQCRIVLVEAEDATFENIAAAENAAAKYGATEISNSYGSREIEVGEETVNRYASAYNHPGIPITVSSGDDGYNDEQFERQETKTGKCLNCSPDFPTDLPTVISVGGTNLIAEGTSGRGWRESAWGYGGSGCTLYVAKPVWQTNGGCSHRSTADIAATAGGETQLSVYDTYGTYGGWTEAAGTSASAPIVAGAIAVESSARRAEGVEGIYKHPERWFDVTQGSNYAGLDSSHTREECEKPHLCVAATGWDGPTGMGTPNGGALSTPPGAVTLPARNVTATAATLRAVVNPEGKTATYSFEYGETTAYGHTVALGSSSAGYTKPSNMSAEVTGLEPATKYHYRVAASSPGGYTKSGDRTFSTASKAHVGNFGSSGEPIQHLSRPMGTAVDATGDVWVADTADNRIVEYSPTGEVLHSCGRAGSGTPAVQGTDIQFNEPVGIVLQPHGTFMWVLDRGNNRVQMLYPQSTSTGCFFWTAFGFKGSNPGQMLEPSGIALGHEVGRFASEGPGEILVTDTGNNRVEVFSAQTSLPGAGTYLGKFGVKGSAEGTWERPTGITTDPTERGIYYVVDPVNGHVDKIRVVEGETAAYVSYLGRFGAKTGAGGTFSSPYGIASDPSTGDLFVTDLGSDQVQEFLPGGTYVGSFSGPGSSSVSLEDPTGLSFNSEGKGYVADQGHSRVSVWGPASTKWRLTGTPSPAETLNSWFNDVSCTVASGCTAVGEWSPNGRVTESTLVDRWNGSEWTLQSTPNPAGSELASLNGVSCPAMVSCVAVGDYRTSAGTYFSLGENWNGAEWKVVPTPEPSGALNGILNGSSCVSRSTCTAVGYFESKPGEVLAMAEQWNGSTWAVEALPALVGAKQVALTSVSCVAKTACTAVGYSANGGSRAPLVARWNGTKWTLEPLGLPAGAKGAQLTSVSCVAEACTAVGIASSEAGVESGLIEKSSGSSWSTQTIATPPRTKGNALYGVSCVTAADCTAAGVNQNIEGKYETLAEHWDGESWAWQSTPNVGGEGFLSGGIACRPGGFCAAVGNKGKSLAVVHSESLPVSEGTPPWASTEEATAILTNGATLRALVNGEGPGGEFFFEYGPTTAYGSKSLEAGLNPNVLDTHVGIKVRGLQSGTTYHYRVVMQTIYGIAYGEDKTFTTS